MKFQNDDYQDEIEVNFIPLVDVLLVIIIFLVVSTTFSKLSELKIKLPTAIANPQDSNCCPSMLRFQKMVSILLIQKNLPQEILEKFQKDF